jgi:hypothetical protein
VTDEVEVSQELIPLMFPDVIGFSIDILMTLLGHKIFATEQRKFNHRPENFNNLFMIYCKLAKKVKTRICSPSHSSFFQCENLSQNKNGFFKVIGR